MLFSKVLAALLLATGINAVPIPAGDDEPPLPPGKSVIGYRTVSKLEAERITAANGPIWDGQEAKGGKQIGPGVYTSYYPGAWSGYTGDWYCVIYVDTSALHDVQKAWIPEYFSTFPTRVLWWSSGTEIDYYIRTFSSDKDPDKTLKLSWVSQYGRLTQMLIPPALLAADQNMGFSAVCKEKKEDLPHKADVSYSGPNWENKMDGSAGEPDS